MSVAQTRSLSTKETGSTSWRIDKAFYSELTSRNWFTTKWSRLGRTYSNSSTELIERLLAWTVNQFQLSVRLRASEVGWDMSRRASTNWRLEKGRLRALSHPAKSHNLELGLKWQSSVLNTAQSQRAYRLQNRVGNRTWTWISPSSHQSLDRFRIWIS